MANLVSTETFEKLVAAGWAGPRPDAQEIADQLPEWTNFGFVNHGDKVELYNSMPDGSELEQLYAPTMAEALALLWLKLEEAK